MTAAVSDSLHLVGAELAATLDEARSALEQYAEGREDPRTLERCADLLHTARGALRVTETYGASLLAEEMEGTCRHLGKLRRNDGGADEAIEALGRAAVQLPGYIERILGGGRDIPLVLLPLLNDLRAARGRPLLSESTLLLLNVAVPSAQSSGVDNRQISGKDIGQLCKSLRPGFQLALLGWIKGVNVGDNLRQMFDVAVELENASVSNEVHRLWWVVSGVLEALLEDGLETSVSLKRLMGQADREMKRLQSIDEAQFIKGQPEDLLNNLLYYIARAESKGERITSIRKAFNLSGLMPDGAQLSAVRESLSAPSVHLMQTVAGAIRDDLARVKDVLDIYVRTGMEHVEELVPQVDLLKKISDTLGVLGLGDLRETVQTRRRELEALIAADQAPEEGVLVGMATALLNVEDRLDQDLLGLIAPTDVGESSQQAEPADNEFEDVTQAVMRESASNLQRVREAVSQVLERPDDAQVLDSVPQLMRGITAGLLILEREQAVAVVEGIAGAIRTNVSGDTTALNPAHLDLLADAIVSLEYYLETLQAGRKEPAYMLDNALRCLEALGEVETPAQRFPEREISGLATTMQVPEPATQVIIPTEPPPAMSAAAQRIDPELLELFIEEAGEEIESIRQQFPLWAADAAQTDALLSLRRSFHTLKGSGRMVGAEMIGEYSWRIESLLNRIINGSITATPSIVEFIEESIAALPELLEQLEVGSEPQVDITGLMERATALAEQREPVAVDSEPETEASVATDEPQQVAKEPADSHESPPRLDATLLDILSKEIHGHLEIIREFLADCADSVGPYKVSESLHRACHTLHGSVTMAKVDPIAELTGPLNVMVRRAFDHSVPVPETVIDACAESVSTLEAALAWLANPESGRPEIEPLRERLQVLDEEIEAIASTSEAGEETIPPDQPLDVRDVDAAARENQPELDAEIVAIYADEAAEILENVDETLDRLSGDTPDAQMLADFQRSLHTLKGGARLAGLLPMGDLSHDLETLLAQFDRERRPLDDELRDLLRTSVDELHRLRDIAEQGRSGQPQQILLARIQAALAGEVASRQEEPSEEPVTDSEIEAAETEGHPVADTPAEDQPIAVDEAPEEPADEEQPDDAEIDVAAGSAAEESEDGEPVPLAGRSEPEPVVDTGQSARIPALEKVVQLARELDQPPVAAEGGLDKFAAPAAATASDSPAPQERRDSAKVDPAVLEKLLNEAGEISILQSRLGQQLGQVQFNLDELGQTVVRLRDQLRSLELATEAQILYRHQSDMEKEEGFDPLEMDRYSRIQHLSRGLAETASDVNSLKDLLHSLVSEAEALLVQHSRTANELQDGLMRTRMVPFQQHTQRLARLVRQTASEYGKRAELVMEGAGELDRQVLERMLPPFEHLLRNAVVHGIERPDVREQAGKPAGGTVSISLRREGSEVIIDVSDDGRGIDTAIIKRKAIESGMIEADGDITDEEAMQFILRPGFSTADHLTQAAGRGIGMDVVASEISKLGGTLRIQSEAGQGTRFSIRLPFTLAVTQALIVRTGKELYALPLPTIEGIIRISRAEFDEKIREPEPSIVYGGHVYYLRHLGQFIGLGPSRLAPEDDRISLILVHAGENSAALLADEVLDSREIVVKAIGEQLASIRGISGATILGDGRIVVILDAGALVRSARPEMEPPSTEVDSHSDQTLVLVVDDSITMRRVTQRLLERNGMRVLTAKDGVEAVAVLQNQVPDIILLDIEMPRMDGYEFATHVRNNPETRDLPIIMITSRVSDKHKARAIEIGVNDYLGKPYQEQELLAAVQHFLEPA